MRFWSGFEIDYEIQGTFEQRNYCVQYKERDFDFAARLMEEEGIYYFFENTNSSHRMIMGNTPSISSLNARRKLKIPFHLWCQADRRRR